uniref:Uncharacterized protein n=1 Tax=Trichobilharzia regenti TaxID=157069 RepID=A0AA85ISG5_TRIRE|nr:unnamed protein product [Trichobilharzia regenti]
MFHRIRWTLWATLVLYIVYLPSSESAPILKLICQIWPKSTFCKIYDMTKKILDETVKNGKTSDSDSDGMFPVRSGQHSSSEQRSGMMK